MNRLPIPVSVAIGAVAGVLVRWALFEVLDANFEEARTILVNALGCLLMGAFVRRSWSDQIHSAATLGFCGGLTTFSTFALDSAVYFDDARWVSGVLYVVVTIIASTAAYIVGRQTSTWATQ